MSVNDPTHPSPSRTPWLPALHRWWRRWRMFWMACAELFGYDGGNEWRVGRYRFGKAD